MLLMRTIVALTIALSLFCMSAAAAQKKIRFLDREGPASDESIKGLNCKIAGRALERMAAKRANRLGIKFLSGKDAIIQIDPKHIPKGVKSGARHKDKIIVDGNKLIGIEETFGDLGNKSQQRRKDQVLNSKGGTFKKTGKKVRLATSIYSIANTPGPRQQKNLTKQGLAFFNYLTGENNFDQLPAAKRPSEDLRRKLFQRYKIPEKQAALIEVSREITKAKSGQSGRIPGPGFAFACVSAAAVAADLATDVIASWSYADLRGKLEADIDQQIAQIASRIEQGKQTWVRISLTGDCVGPFAWICQHPDSTLMPTLTSFEVRDLAQPGTECTAGKYRSIPVIASPGRTVKRTKYHDLCVEGTKTPSLTQVRLEPKEGMQYSAYRLELVTESTGAMCNQGKDAQIKITRTRNIRYGHVPVDDTWQYRIPNNVVKRMLAGKWPCGNRWIVLTKGRGCKRSRVVSVNLTFPTHLADDAAVSAYWQKPKPDAGKTSKQATIRAGLIYENQCRP